MRAFYLHPDYDNAALFEWIGACLVGAEDITAQGWIAPMWGANFGDDDLVLIVDYKDARKRDVPEAPTLFVGWTDGRIILETESPRAAIAAFNAAYEESTK